MRQRPDQGVRELHRQPAVQRLNDRFSLFAYAIEGLDVMDRLREGDILLRARVEDGVWSLSQPEDLD